MHETSSTSESTHMNEALWGGRFEDSPTEFTQAFGASLPVDQRMWESDIEGSKAHALMLARQGVISEEDAEDIRAGLDAIAARIEEGDFDFDINDEDIHMSIERNLTEAIGAAGGRLHTGRSRNDQVATDTRHHAKKLADGLAHQVLDLRGALLDLAQDNFGVVMPGYTHMQKAQPVLFSHHVLAYYWMFARDFERLRAAYRAADVLPLGSAALAGTTYPLDRHFVADELGFAAVAENSMDAVSDRDFLLDLSYACSVAMMHLSRLCEELIYWSSNEFGFIRLSDAYSTGSSIMPQKKNPDFAELIRGKTGRVYGDLMALLTTMKGLPLAYNKDMQEDKEALFDARDTLVKSLVVFNAMLAACTFNTESMARGAAGGFTNATDAADYLVKKGMPFRDAHAVIGHLVLHCVKENKAILDLSLDELKTFSELFEADVYEACSMHACVELRDVPGGPAPNRVEVSIKAGQAWLDAFSV